MNKKFIIIKSNINDTEKKINEFLKKGYKVHIVNQQIISYDVGTMCPTYIIITSLWLYI